MLYKSTKLVDYPIAEKAMQAYIKKLYMTQEIGAIWLLEHPSIYTAGTSASHEDLLNPKDVPVFYTNRGGKFTYHGPGQRIVYVMLNLAKIRPDIRLFINQLQDWIILTLESIGIKAYKSPEGVGIWVKDNDIEKKIASIGVRLSKWISYHGVAINICPRLEYFNGIIPCGLKNSFPCSVQSLGVDITIEEFDSFLIKMFYNIFNIPLIETNEDFLQT